MIDWQSEAGGIEYGFVHGVILFTLQQADGYLSLFDWNDVCVRTGMIESIIPSRQALQVSSFKKHAEALFDEHFREDLKDRLMELLLLNEVVI